MCAVPSFLKPSKPKTLAQTTTPSDVKPKEQPRVILGSKDKQLASNSSVKANRVGSRGFQVPLSGSTSVNPLQVPV